MPLVNVKCIEGVFSDSQKKQLVERLTDAMVSIEGENLRQVTWVVIEEVKSGDWREPIEHRSRKGACVRQASWLSIPDTRGFSVASL